MALLRTYRSVLAFPRGEEQTLAEALLGPPCFAPQAEERQGEAIAFTGDGRAYVTVSEGANPTIDRVALSEPAATTTSAAPPTTGGTDDARPGDDGNDADDDSATAAHLVGAAVALVVLGGGAVLWSRRRRPRSGAG